MTTANILPEVTIRSIGLVTIIMPVQPDTRLAGQEETGVLFLISPQLVALWVLKEIFISIQGIPTVRRSLEYILKRPLTRLRRIHGAPCLLLRPASMKFCIRNGTKPSQESFGN